MNTVLFKILSIAIALLYSVIFLTWFSRKNSQEYKSLSHLQLVQVAPVLVAGILFLTAIVLGLVFPYAKFRIFALAAMMMPVLIFHLKVSACSLKKIKAPSFPKALCFLFYVIFIPFAALYLG